MAGWWPSRRSPPVTGLTARPSCSDTTAWPPWRSRGRPHRARAWGRQCSPWRRSPKSCRRASATNGPASRCSSSKRDRRHRTCTRSRCSWSSSASPRSTRAGRSRSPSSSWFRSAYWARPSPRRSWACLTVSISRWRCSPRSGWAPRTPFSSWNLLASCTKRAARRRGRGREAADAPDPDDLHGIPPGRSSARARERRGLGEPERDWHRRDRRDVGLDFHRPIPRANVLRGGQPEIQPAEARARAGHRAADMRKHHVSLLVLMGAVAAGCSLQPIYERPAAPVAGAFPSGAAYKSAQSGQAGAALPAADTGWRDFLTDPRLQRLVEIALANNRDLRVAMLNVAEVQAQYRIQRAALAPQVSGFADGSHSRTPGSLSKSGTPLVTHAYETGVSAAWEVDLFGRLRSLSDAALEQYFATAYARQAAEILLVSQVADQYLTTLAFDEQLAVTRQTLATAQASYTIVKLQFDTGTAPELTLQQALSVVEQANANYAAQVRARAQAENGLVLLIGEPLPADLPPALPMGEQKILADIPAGLPSDLLTRRPDILQAEALLRSENADIGAAR